MSNSKALSGRRTYCMRLKCGALYRQSPYLLALLGVSLFIQKVQNLQNRFQLKAFKVDYCHHPSRGGDAFSQTVDFTKLARLRGGAVNVLAAGMYNMIGFELALADLLQENLNVMVMVDPTPVAVQHWSEVSRLLISKHTSGETLSTGNSFPTDSYVDECWKCDFNPTRLQHLQIALSNISHSLTFNKKERPGRFPIYSLTPLDAAYEFGFVVPALSIDAIGHLKGVWQWDVLKIDIEGSEVPTISTYFEILSNRPGRNQLAKGFPLILLIDFDSARSFGFKEAVDSVQLFVQTYGYRLCEDRNWDITFALELIADEVRCNHGRFRKIQPVTAK